MVQGKTHLSLFERKQIEDGLNKCLSLGSIARLLGRHAAPGRLSLLEGK